MDSLPDAYVVLQIHPEAEPSVLDAALRALARQYHPDGSMPDATRMAEINRAYAMVRTPELRSEYDRHRAADGARSRATGPHAGAIGCTRTRRRRTLRPRLAASRSRG